MTLSRTFSSATAASLWCIWCCVKGWREIFSQLSEQSDVVEGGRAFCKWRRVNSKIHQRDNRTGNDDRWGTASVITVALMICLSVGFWKRIWGNIDINERPSHVMYSTWITLWAHCCFFLCSNPDDVTAQMKYRHKRENKEHRPRKQTLNIYIRDATYVTSISSGKEAGT